MIKVIIIDDHQLFIDGLLQVFQSDSQISIIDYALDGSTGVNKVKCLQPDVVILDIEFTKTKESGVDILKTIKKSNKKVLVLILTGYCDKSLIDELHNEGANGYRLKNIGFNDLKQSILDIFAGEVVYKYESGMMHNYEQISAPQISRRAMEIIKLLAQGSIVKEIAQNLGIAETTVHDHIERTRRKLDAKNTSELVFMASKNGLI